MKTALSFDDVLLVPTMFSGDSRNSVVLDTIIGRLHLQIPIISANMSTITEDRMADAMSRLGGLGIIHRMNTVEEEAELVKNVSQFQRLMPKVGMSIGVDKDWLERLEKCILAGADLICIDVAHAHQPKVLEIAKDVLRRYDLPLIVGNIATRQAAMDIVRYVGDSERLILKVGIGGGSLCTTRIQTGCGIPTFQSILDIVEFKKSTGMRFSIIADGGIKSSGDIVKALAAGADAVMLGSLLAGTRETPGEIITKDGIQYKKYAGSASFSVKGYDSHIEGTETWVPLKPPVEEVIKGLVDGIKSGFSYCGANNLKELHKNAEFIQITSAGHQESKPHGVL